MKIENAQYGKSTRKSRNSETNENSSVNCIIDGSKWSVPLDPANRHYAEILKQVKEGTLTIKDAD